MSYPALVENPVMGGCTGEAAIPAADSGLIEEGRGGKGGESTGRKVELVGKGKTRVDEGGNWERIEHGVVKELLK